MTSWAFPLLGAALVYGLVAPLLTLAALPWLRWRRARHGVAVEGDGLGYATLLAPVLLPLGWSVSAAVHLSEPGGPLASCRLDGAGPCMDEAWFGVAVAAPLFLAFVAVAAGRRGGRRRWAPDLLCRLAALRRRHPGLRRVAVRLVDGEAPPVALRGVFASEVALREDFARRLDDQALVAALLHEAEHARGRDVLRLALLEATLRVNPLGWLLRSEARRWEAARELRCDAAAVRRGGSPLGLAHAIVQAARWTVGDVAAALTGGGASLVQLRVQLLLEASEGRSGLEVEEPPTAGAAVGGSLLLAAAWPHVLGTGWLDGFHAWVEGLSRVAQLG